MTALAKIQRDEIQGLRWQSAAKVAERLQLAADANPNFRPEYWPTHNVGAKFANVVATYLARPEPPAAYLQTFRDQAKLERLWTLTKRWRVDCFQEACAATGKPTQELDLRRGALMNAVGRTLGLPAGSRVNDIAELFSLAGSHEESHALQIFCQWLCECYQYNQAIEFGATPNFPGHEALVPNLITPSLFQPTGATETPAPARTFRATVPFPPLIALRTIPADELLKARDDSGLGYWLALRRWAAAPSDATKKEVAYALAAYSKDIVGLCKASFRDALLEVVAEDALLAMLLEPGAAFLDVWKTGGLATASLLVSYALVSTAEAGYRWYTRRPAALPLRIVASEDVAAHGTKDARGELNISAKAQEFVKKEAGDSSGVQEKRAYARIGRPVGE